MIVMNYANFFLTLFKKKDPGTFPGSFICNDVSDQAALTIDGIKPSLPI